MRRHGTRNLLSFIAVVTVPCALCGCGEAPVVVMLSGCPDSVMASETFAVSITTVSCADCVFTASGSTDLVISDDDSTVLTVRVDADAVGPRQLDLVVTRGGQPLGRQVCVFEVCRRPACSSDVDCDDGDPGTPDVCNDLGCADGAECLLPELRCTRDEHCRPLDPESVCTEGTCVVVERCASDAECDDGVPCNGAETCTPDGDCAAGPPPCAVDECCTESGCFDLHGPSCAGVCACANGPAPAGAQGGTSLTRDVDRVCATGADLFIDAPLEFSPEVGALVATLQTDDCIDGGGGRLQAVFSALFETTVRPAKLVRVAALDVTDIGAARTTVDLANTAGLERMRAVGSLWPLTVRGLFETVEIGLVRTGAGASLRFEPAATSAGPSMLAVTLEATTGGTLAVDAGGGNGFAAARVRTVGDQAAVLGRLTHTTGGPLEAVDFAGTAGLELRAVDASVVRFDASALDTSTPEDAAGLTLGSGDGSAEQPFVGLHAGGNGAVETLIGSPGPDLFVFAGTFDAADGGGAEGWLDGGGGIDGFQAILSGTQRLSAGGLETLHLRAAAAAELDVSALPDLTDVWIHGAAQRAGLPLALRGPGPEPPLLHYRGDGRALDQVYDALAVVDAAFAGVDDTLAVRVDNREVGLGSAGVFRQHVIGALSVPGIEHLTMDVADGPLAVLGGISGEVLRSVTLSAVGRLDLGQLDAGSAGTLETLDAGSVAQGVIVTLAGVADGAVLTLGPGDDALVLADGPAAALTLMLGAGHDEILSNDLDAAETIDAGPGDDVVTAGAGIDRLTGGPGADVFVLSGITSAMDADVIADFEPGVGGDRLRFDPVTFDDYAAGMVITLAAGGPANTALTVAVDNVVIIDTAAAVAQTTPSAGTQGVLAVAVDTGEVVFAPAGDFTASDVAVIATLTPSAAAGLAAGNIEIVP